MADADVRGFSELEELLKKLPDEIAKKTVVNGLKAGGRLLVKGMKARVPVKTGKLRDSIVVTTSRRSTKGKGQAVIAFRKPVSRRVHLTEFGTKHAKAHPFIRPTLDTEGAAAIEAIGKALGSGVVKAAQGLYGK
jgi:HK97 gp10 family phage protein